MVWPVLPDLHGLVDFGYSVQVRLGSGPVLPDARAALVWLGDGRSTSGARGRGRGRRGVPARTSSASC